MLRSILFLVLFLTGQALAYTHGLNTTFDPNAWGGSANVACLTAAIPGTCDTGFNAVCSPSGAPNADDAAATAFNAYAVAKNPNQVVLYMPPGKVCHTEGQAISSGIQSLVWWAFGAKASNQNIGGEDFYTDAVHQAKVATVSAGSSTVTLLTPSEISRFAVNMWTAMTGISVQTDGFAANFQLYEYKKVVSISTDCPSPCTFATVTLDSLLSNTYKSTWPYLGISSAGNDLGGPATLFALKPTYKINLQIFGLALLQDANPVAGSNVVGSDITFHNVNHEGAGWGFRVTNLNLYNTGLPGATEFDKDMVNVNIYYPNVTGNGLFFTDPSPLNLTIQGGSAPGINGTGQNATISRFTVAGNIGTGAGQGGSASTLALNNVSFQGQHTFYRTMLASMLSFSNGRFTVLKSDPNISQVYATAIPGKTLYFGDTQGSNFDCSPATNFVVTDLSEDATHIFIDTNLNTMPTVTCGNGGSPGPQQTYGLFHLQSAPTLSNSGPGTFPDPETHP